LGGCPEAYRLDFPEMHKIIDIKETISGLLSEAIRSSGLLSAGEESPDIEILAPKEKPHGDLTTNVILKLNSKSHTNAVDNAKAVTDRLNVLLPESSLRDSIRSIEFKKPGFINFFFSDKFLTSILTDIVKSPRSFGRSSIGKGKSVLIEFVSANPTGPLTIAHGRQAAVGDSLARILSFSGYKVYKEYYVNDFGVQIGLLARSIMARYEEMSGKNSPIPEGGYQGEYIIGIAEDIAKRFGRKIEGRVSGKEGLFRDHGMRYILKGIKKDLDAFGVKFDRFFHESSLHKKRAVSKALSELQGKEALYEKDGALWFKSSGFGDDKDRVVRKSDGSYTYLAPDIAYHKDKFKRRMDILIDIWGPDHHGYMPRLKHAVKALGYDDERIKILIVQLVSLFEGTKQVPMSTRKGEFLTLKQIMDEVGRDAARFFFVMRNTSSHLDFDLDLAKKHSLDNPVYYIQYAHARIASILAFAREKIGRVDMRKAARGEYLNDAEGMEIVRILADFPECVSVSAKTLEPSRIVEYLTRLASAFHSFYNKSRFVTEDRDLTLSKLLPAYAVKAVLANGLELLGVVPLEKM